MLFILTGDGKGKTTSAVGMGVRAAGAGLRVFMAQFLKTGKSSEIKTIKQIRNFDIQQTGRNFFKKEVKIEKYDLLILDEINVALKFGLINLEELLTFLKKYNKKKYIILTGRWCPKEIMKIADMVTEFKEIKHYFKKGVKAKKGIEY